MIDTVIFQCACAKLPYFYFSLKSDITIMFLDLDFVYDAGILATREYYRQKLEYLRLNGFSGPFGPKWGKSGATIIPMNSFFLLGVPVFFRNVRGFIR